MADVRKKDLDTLTGKAATSSRVKQYESDANVYKTTSLLKTAGNLAETGGRVRKRGSLD